SIHVCHWHSVGSSARGSSDRRSLVDGDATRPCSRGKDEQAVPELVRQVALAGREGEGAVEQRPRREGAEELEVALAGDVEAREQAVDDRQAKAGSDPKIGDPP